MRVLRPLYLAGLLALLAWSVWGGYGRIAGFFHRFAGERQLTRAEMTPAYRNLTAALRWLPEDTPSLLMLSRVMALAQANGLPIDGIDRAKPEQSLAIGFAAVSTAVSLSPADAWSWFNLAEVYSAHQSARSRMERLLAAGRRVAAEREGAPGPEPPETSGPFHPEDRIRASAVLMAQRLEPEFYYYHDYLARLYWERSLEEAAASELRASFALMPQPRAHTLLDEGEIQEELTEAILEGIEEAGRSPFIEPLLVLEARAEFFERIRNLEEAVRALEALRDAGGEPYEGDCSLRIARVYQGMDRWEESLPLLERVLAAEPDGSRGTAALLHLGFAYARLGDPEKSVAYLRRHLTRRAGSLKTMLTLAEGLAATGDPREAGRIYEAMVDRFPEDREAYIAAIRHLRDQRMYEDALDYAFKLRDRFPEDGTADSLIRRIEAERD